jgi:hypothetical protein
LGKVEHSPDLFGVQLHLCIFSQLDCGFLGKPILSSVLVEERHQALEVAMEDAVDVVFPNEVGPEVGQGIFYFSAVICILQEDFQQSVEAVGVLGDVRSLLYELKEGVV